MEASWRSSSSSLPGWGLSGLLLPAAALLLVFVAGNNRSRGSSSSVGGMDDSLGRRRRGLAEEGGHEGAATNVFALALTTMDQQEIGWMMVAVLVSQLVLDEGLRRVEASVGANARACLREVYKELSTLGLISFTLFMVQSFESNVDHATLEAFEYSHIFVFSFAIVYVIQSAVLIASITPIQRRLIRLHAYGDAVADAVAALPPSPPAFSAGPFACLRSLCGGMRSQEAAAARAFDGFRAFRKQFLRKHALPASFLYDWYLIEVYDRWVIVKLDIAAWCWALMCLIFGLHALAANYSRFASFCLNRWTFLAYGWLLLLADCALFLLVHCVHSRVLQRLRSGGGHGERLDVSLATSASVNTCASSTAAAAGDGSVRGEDALEALRRRREALYAQYYHQQHQQQQQQQQHGSSAQAEAPLDVVVATDDEFAATVGSINGPGGSHGLTTAHADIGVLRHPPRHFTLGGGRAMGNNLTAVNGGGGPGQGPRVAAAKGGDDDGASNGFTPLEGFAFNYGTEALNVLRCLYLAAWLCTYAVPAFLEWFPTGWAVLYVLAIPVPAIITGTALIPRMVTRFLLVTSLSLLDLEAFDAVLEHMEEADSALAEIAHLLRRLAAADDDTGGGAEGKGVERLFASLAQHHHALALSSTTLRNCKLLGTAPRTQRVAPASSAIASDMIKMPPHISYAQLHHFLGRHGVHLPARRFRALVRFVDSDLCGHIDLKDFKALLQADHLFCTASHHPSAARAARLLSQHSQQTPARVVLREVGRLLRHGSTVLAEQHAGADAGAEREGEGGGEGGWI